MFSSILSCINALTISPAALPAGLTLPDLRLMAAQLLGLVADNGTIAAPLESIAGEVEQPAGVVLAVLQALAAAGLVVFGVVPVSGGAWVVAWFVGWSGAILTGNISSEAPSLETKAGNAGGSDCLFVCSTQSPSDLNIKTNKQTAYAHAHAYAREGTPAADAAPASGAVTGNISSDKARIVALLTDPAVVAGLVVRSSGQVVGAMDRDKARELAAELVKAGRDFSFVLGNVCEWRRQVEGGRVFSPLPALVSRLRRGFDGSITDADRALAWFAKHSPESLDLWAAAGMSAPDLPVVVDAAPAAGAVVSPCDRSVITGNISSDEHAAAWDRFLAWLRTAGDLQAADLLEGSAASPSAAGAWVVRLGWRGGALAINGGKWAGRLGADLAAFLGAPAPLAVEFVAGD